MHHRKAVAERLSRSTCRGQRSPIVPGCPFTEISNWIGGPGRSRTVIGGSSGRVWPSYSVAGPCSPRRPGPIRAGRTTFGAFPGVAGTNPVPAARIRLLISGHAGSGDLRCVWPVFTQSAWCRLQVAGRFVHGTADSSCDQRSRCAAHPHKRCTAGRTTSKLMGRSSRARGGHQTGSAAPGRRKRFQRGVPDRSDQGRTW